MKAACNNIENNTVPARVACIDARAIVPGAAQGFTSWLDRGRPQQLLASGAHETSGRWDRQQRAR